MLPKPLTMPMLLLRFWIRFRHKNIFHMKLWIRINFIVHSLSSWRLGVKIHTTTRGRLSDERTHKHSNQRLTMKIPKVLHQCSPNTVNTMFTQLCFLHNNSLVSLFYHLIKLREDLPTFSFAPLFCWFSLKTLSEYEELLSVHKTIL